ncbi:hypothetical protein X945_3214 [Burkholderia pseudomallei ABCPW 107]|uniref:hypothetical protein n=1 Tax=Burkholderia pseudomallei TaxID=28450 RepID=UPI000530F6C2|nr:hypothetical protein [Burkholderia pseudomallei]KGS43887.1 hypothetical protein X945_3214 [Burkholderia pseudomallei ABCPW 107]
MTGKLTFHIERDGEFSVLTYKGGGCRPATPEEIELWEALLASTQQASTEIDELKAKLASYEREREDQNRYLAAQSEEIAGLKQRLAQQPCGEVTDDKLDAERYRWLREQSNDPNVLPRIEAVRWEAIDESANGGEGLRMEALDSAIDAARTQGGES